MQQQIQVSQSPEQCLAEAAAFFARRRAKVSERTAQGFRFWLEGTEAEVGGRVTVTPGGAGGTTVTVEADGLGVLAIAEGFVRELRKQSKGAGRQTRQGVPVGVSSGFTDLRQRLGMPEPALERPPRPPVAARPRPVEGAPAQETSGQGAPAQGAPAQGAPGQGAPGQGAPGQESVAAVTPVGADAPPAPRPRDADPAGAAVTAAAVAGAASNQGAPPPAPPEEGQAAAVPSRELATTAGDAGATTVQRPGHESLASQAPTAEQIGGVPQPGEVQLTGETRPNPVTEESAAPEAAGGPAGIAAPEAAGGPEAVAAPEAVPATEGQPAPTADRPPGRQSPGPAAGEPAGAGVPPER